MRKLALVVALVAMTAFPLGAAFGSDADQVPVTATGWWSDFPLFQPSVSSQTSTPPGGDLAVGSSSPQDRVGVAAMEVELGLTGVTHLVVGAADDSGQLDSGGGALRICLTDETWTPAAPGPQAAAPAFHCEKGSVPFVKDGKGQWKADVTTLVAGRSGIVSLGIDPILVGSTDPAVASPYAIYLKPPTVVDAALATMAPTLAPAPGSVMPAAPVPAPSADALSPLTPVHPGGVVAPPTTDETPRLAPVTPASLAPTPSPVAIPTFAAPAANESSLGRSPLWLVLLLSMLVGLVVTGGSKLAGRR